MGFFKEKIWQDKKKRALFITLSSVFLALILIFTACAIYLGSYYRADDEAVSAFSFSTGYTITETQTEDGNWVFAPQKDEVDTGFIFYPGGKVEHDAYIPLMRALAVEGVFCVLIEMPFRLAVFDIDAADGIAEGYPQIKNWYIGGHSLGGSMAASYVSKHTADFKGLILLAAYSTENLQNSGLRVLSVYGDKDGVLNRGKYNENKCNLPQDYTEYIIEGGNHAYFGMYGKQKGDGEATVDNGYQIILTAHQIRVFMDIGFIGV